MTESSLKNQIENTQKKHPNSLILVSGSWCARCRTLKTFLNSNGIGYEEILIDTCTEKDLKEAFITAIPTVIKGDVTLVDPTITQIMRLK